MFGLLRPLSQIFTILPKTSAVTRGAPFHSLTCGMSPNQCMTQRVGGLFDITTRNVIRVHFPRPNEIKRVRKHGWEKRMSTPAGRRILMHRILKGRYIYSH